MAPVHDFRHVEIDNIGRGKRVLKPPGGECSDIFNVSPSPSLDHTPRRQRSYLQSTIFSPSDSVDGTPTPSKKGHDTQNRLFGPPDEGATPKVVVDRQKSNIFSPAEDGGRTGSGKKQARRNPITGEVAGEVKTSTPYTNGHATGQDGMNGDATPVRNSRVPPGGRCSGIF